MTFDYQKRTRLQVVHTVSRIVGLEACEGLLILDKGYLYLIKTQYLKIVV